MLFVRLITQDGCDRCALYKSMLDKHGFKYEVYDGAHPDHQKQLDEWKVFDMPVVQIIFKDDVSGVERMEYQFPFVEKGGISIRSINTQMSMIKKKLGIS